MSFLPTEIRHVSHTTQQFVRANDTTLPPPCHPAPIIKFVPKSSPIPFESHYLGRKTKICGFGDDDYLFKPTYYPKKTSKLQSTSQSSLSSSTNSIDISDDESVDDLAVTPRLDRPFGEICSGQLSDCDNSPLV